MKIFYSLDLHATLVVMGNISDKRLETGENGTRRMLDTKDDNTVAVQGYFRRF